MTSLLSTLQDYEALRLCVCTFSVTSKSVQVSVLYLSPSARQHPSYGDCLELKREYYQNSSVLDCVTKCSQSAAHLY